MPDLKIVSKTPELTVDQLKSTNKLYKKFIKEWVFLYAAYEGTRELIEHGYLVKHERETQENYENRCNKAYGFNYTQSVVDILNFYLCKKPVKRILPQSIENDNLYHMFQDDCNMEGDNLDDYLAEISRLFSIMGLVGILVDKPSVNLEDRQQQIENSVYPYLSTFFPNAIMDWDIGRNEFGRITLNMIKLHQENDRIIIWYPDQFEVWEIPKDKDGNEVQGSTKANMISANINPLEEIPFIFAINKKWKKPPIGKSDVSDIARIDVSIIRNLSQGEEIIDYSAFPMMRKPFEESRPGIDTDQNNDVGPTAVLGFDPDNPESKPDWLSSESDKPLNAIKDWIVTKVSEIYRSSNIGGMAATEISTTAKSGIALNAEFQMLNSTLVRKAINLEKIEKTIHYFYYKWEMSDQAINLEKETVIEREREYDVDNLKEDLENIITAKTIVLSKTFDTLLQKKIVRQMLPAYTDTQLKDIDDEIDSGIEQKIKEDKNKTYNPFDEIGLNDQNNQV